MTSEPDASTDLPDSAEVAATFIELTGAVTGGPMRWRSSPS